MWQYNSIAFQLQTCLDALLVMQSSSLSADSMLSVVSRGRWRDTAGGRGFPSWFQCMHSSCGLLCHTGHPAGFTPSKSWWCLCRYFPGGFSGCSSWPLSNGFNSDHQEQLLDAWPAFRQVDSCAQSLTRWHSDGDFPPCQSCPSFSDQ